jgi:hypothetical protein
VIRGRAGRLRLVLTLASVLGGAPSCAGLQPRGGSAARFVGTWTGRIAWGEPARGGDATPGGRAVRPFPPICYVWCLRADGRFTSGREGRGQDGTGRWTASGSDLVLRYGNGVRYDGRVAGGAFRGTARRADGVTLGGVAMVRAQGGACS